jgi:hypothetical protein
MKNRAWLTLILTLLAATAEADERRTPARKVLVELYTSQGCDSCPAASDLLGKLTKLGYGPDRIVAINFHVDAFNNPWVDPYSEPAFTQRTFFYNQVLHRRDLAFTPLMMVDGHEPLVGSNRAAALSAITRASREPATVSLGLKVEGEGSKRSAHVTIRDAKAELIGRDLMIHVALTEEPVSTRVTAGENAGRTLVEHHVARRFVSKPVILDETNPTTVTVPLELPDGQPGARFRVVAFLQDRASGQVYQAESVPCRESRPAVSLKRPTRHARHRNPAPPSFADLASYLPQAWIDDPPACAACGNPYPTPFLVTLPPVYLPRNGSSQPNLPLPDC